jgi:competence protein ComEC
VPSVALVPACALIAGVSAGILLAEPIPFLSLALAVVAAAAGAAWRIRRGRAALVCATLAYVLAGVALGSHEAAAALAPSIRTVLDREVGGFALSSPGPPAAHQPLTIRARLEEDPVVRARHVPGPREEGVAVRVGVEVAWIGGVAHAVHGGVRLSIAGAAAARRADAWRAGRRIEVPVTFHRPARYLNDGVADFERGLALDGIALNATVKSALLVDVVARGTAVEEWCADVRALVRSRVTRWVASRDALAGGVVTAILIGDRTGLPDEVRTRLQAAGTYHVIAISGGNVAILAALIAGVLLVAGVSGRWATAMIVVGVVGYAAVVNAGPSVWRATVTAVAYLVARAIDHRTPPWNAMAVSAALLACVAPLDVRDAGFALTFGATAAIVEAAARVPRPGAGSPPRAQAASWLLASVAASAAAEIVLLPIAASVFSRVTCAGLVLNLVAVPLMTIAQVAGLVVVAGGQVQPLAQAAGALAAWAARGLVESARLVDVIPWLAIRVAEPSLFVIALYYAALAGTWWPSRVPPHLSAARPARKRACAAVLVACGVLILTGATPQVRGLPQDGRARLTIFDVGQAEAILLQTPGRRTLLVDAGGAGFDGAAFDIGSRVLAPALWARGVRRLDAFAVTHADPDHAGGSLAVLRDFRPRELWLGVPVPRHDADRGLRAAAPAHGAAIAQRFRGETLRLDEVTIRVLHPPAADWERQRVRNDDSLVLEVRHRDVAILLTGDVSADVERAIARQLTPARVRILKAAHHGSRTSTSQQLLDGWQPHIAVISCGRGNRFGHPAPDVIERLHAAGVKVYRTDQDGQITIESTGREVNVRTAAAARTAPSPAATLPPSAPTTGR